MQMKPWEIPRVKNAPKKAVKKSVKVVKKPKKKAY